MKVVHNNCPLIFEILKIQSLYFIIKMSEFLSIGIVQPSQNIIEII